MFFVVPVLSLKLLSPSLMSKVLGGEWRFPGLRLARMERFLPFIGRWEWGLLLQLFLASFCIRGRGYSPHTAWPWRPLSLGSWQPFPSSCSFSDSCFMYSRTEDQEGIFCLSSEPSPLVILRFLSTSSMSESLPRYD